MRRICHERQRSQKSNISTINRLKRESGKCQIIPKETALENSFCVGPEIMDFRVTKTKTTCTLISNTCYPNMNADESVGADVYYKKKIICHYSKF